MVKENLLKQRAARPRISRRAALDPGLAQAASAWCVEHRVRRNTLLMVALRRAMVDPAALEEMRAMDAGVNAARREVRLKRQAIYRHNNLL